MAEGTTVEGGAGGCPILGGGGAGRNRTNAATAMTAAPAAPAPMTFPRLSDRGGSFGCGCRRGTGSRRLAVAPVSVVPAATVAAVEPMAPSPAPASQRRPWVSSIADSSWVSSVSASAGRSSGRGCNPVLSTAATGASIPSSCGAAAGLFTGQGQAAGGGEQSRASEQFGQHDAAAIHIGPLVDGSTRGGLGRHVARGAAQAEVTRGRPQDRNPPASVCRLWSIKMLAGATSPWTTSQPVGIGQTLQRTVNQGQSVDPPQFPGRGQHGR